MARNLDMTSLRSFLAVAESGGVTKAAGFLNLTQPAVSMQLKRLEESLAVGLFDRSGRGIALTPSGEQLLSYARRIVALNDEAWGRLTAAEYEGDITLGVPHDIVSPALPPVLRRFAAAFPRVRVNLVSSFTLSLKKDFERGELDILLTTEDSVDSTLGHAETLATRQIIWIGAADGDAWKRSPLPLAFEERCIFRGMAQRALDRAGISWTTVVESNSTRSIEATVSADLAIHAMIVGTLPATCAPIAHGGALPEIGATHINLYLPRHGGTAVTAAFADLLRAGYRDVPAALAGRTVIGHGDEAARGGAAFEKAL